MIKKLKTAIKIIRLLKNPLLYFKDYFKLIKTPYLLYRLKNGVEYKVRGKTTDRNVINEIWIHNSYTPERFKINQNDLVIDVGAHIGVFSIFASKKANNGKIYAFEPSPENYSLLKENIELNKSHNITLIPKALSDKTGIKDFFISEDDNKGNSSFYSKPKSSEKISVNTTSFSDFIKKHKIKEIDFMKIDCEGGEYDIFFNSPKSIIKKIKKISMEYHNINKKKNGLKLKYFLENLGFDIIMKTEGRKGMIYARLKS